LSELPKFAPSSSNLNKLNEETFNIVAKYDKN
jgi:hypothetical protein